VVELGLPELTTEQIEALCFKAEDAARKYVLSKVSIKEIDKLDVSAEAEGTKPVNLTIEINLFLKEKTENVDADKIVKEAVAAGHKASENFLRSLK
jgi:hypothetical protein